MIPDYFDLSDLFEERRKIKELEETQHDYFEWEDFLEDFFPYNGSHLRIRTVDLKSCVTLDSKNEKKPNASFDYGVKIGRASEVGKKGRLPAQKDNFYIEDPSISATHCEFFKKEGSKGYWRLYIKDNSYHGTVILRRNETTPFRLNRGIEQPIAAGDVIGLVVKSACGDIFNDTRFQFLVVSDHKKSLTLILLGKDAQYRSWPGTITDYVGKHDILGYAFRCYDDPALVDALKVHEKFISFDFSEGLSFEDIQAMAALGGEDKCELKRVSADTQFFEVPKALNYDLLKHKGVIRDSEGQYYYLDARLWEGTCSFKISYLPDGPVDKKKMSAKDVAELLYSFNWDIFYDYSSINQILSIAAENLDDTGITHLLEFSKQLFYPDTNNRRTESLSESDKTLIRELLNSGIVDSTEKASLKHGLEKILKAAEANMDGKDISTEKPAAIIEIESDLDASCEVEIDLRKEKEPLDVDSEVPAVTGIDVYTDQSEEGEEDDGEEEEKKKKSDEPDVISRARTFLHAQESAIDSFNSPKVLTESKGDTAFSARQLFNEDSKLVEETEQRSNFEIAQEAYFKSKSDSEEVDSDSELGSASDSDADTESSSESESESGSESEAESKDEKGTSTVTSHICNDLDSSSDKSETDVGDDWDSDYLSDYVAEYLYELEYGPIPTFEQLVQREINKRKKISDDEVAVSKNKRKNSCNKLVHESDPDSDSESESNDADSQSISAFDSKFGLEEASTFLSEVSSKKRKHHDDGDDYSYDKEEKTKTLSEPFKKRARKFASSSAKFLAGTLVGSFGTLYALSKLAEQEQP